MPAPRNSSRGDGGHLPVGTHFAGAGYILTDGDIAFDPVLQIDGATVRMHTYAAKYIHTFELFDKSARFDWIQGYQDATWEGQLGGQAASTSRSGWSDTLLRFAMNFVVGPPLKGREFAEYRAGIDQETIVGAGLVLVLPSGDYQEDKLLNLGDNRFSIRPQFGVAHAWDQWSEILTL